MFGLSYWLLPLFAGTVWLATLLAMLGWWAARGEPTYWFESSGQHVAYISDIGATKLQPLFIAGSTVMVVVFDLAFISERWLRHRRRLVQTYTKKESFLSWCAIAFAVAGAAGLILLSIFDTRQYPKVHDSMLGLFIGGYVISAIFICAEYQRLGIHYREHRILRISFWIKLFFIIVEVALAVAFGATEYTGYLNISAVLEWIIALLYIFYVYSFIIDFLPAVRTRHHEDRFPPTRRGLDEEAGKTQSNGNLAGGPVYTSGGRHPSDGSAQPMTEVTRGSAQNF